MLNKFFHYNNYCNIDVISRHLVTAGLLCVYVFLYIFLYLVYIYLFAVFFYRLILGE